MQLCLLRYFIWIVHDEKESFKRGTKLCQNQSSYWSKQSCRKRIFEKLICHLGSTSMEVDSGNDSASQAPKVKKNKVSPDEIRKVPIPPHRYTPLRENWLKIFTPVVDHLHLQIRRCICSKNEKIENL